VVPIKRKAMTLLEKLKIIQKVEANPSNRFSDDYVIFIQFLGDPL
jgi:hypothetical protein